MQIMLYDLVKSFVKTFIIIFIFIECLSIFQSESRLNNIILTPYKQSSPRQKENLHRTMETYAITNNEVDTDGQSEKKGITNKQLIYYFNYYLINTLYNYRKYY